MKILVIEDKAHHIDDAKEMFSLNSEILVDYAVNLEEAFMLLEISEYDGIISDIFFPSSDPNTPEKCFTVLEPYHKPTLAKYSEYMAAANRWRNGEGFPPSGVLVVEQAKKHKIPCVLCTDTYHHGSKTQMVHNYQSDNYLEAIRFVDVNDHALGNLEYDKKNWYKASNELLEIVLGKKFEKENELNGNKCYRDWQEPARHMYISCKYKYKIDWKEYKKIKYKED